jgi:hypothetical protein
MIVPADTPAWLTEPLLSIESGEKYPRRPAGKHAVKTRVGRDRLLTQDRAVRREITLNVI